MWDVTQTNTCEHSKEECTFQYFVLAWSLGQHFCFLKCKCLSLNLYIGNALYFGGYVNGQVFVDESTMQTSLNDGEVCGGRILRECAALVSSLRGREHEQFDVFKQLRRDCFERDRLALRVDGQQFTYTSPVDNDRI